MAFLKTFSNLYIYTYNSILQFFRFYSPTNLNPSFEESDIDIYPFILVRIKRLHFLKSGYLKNF